jgi:phytoene dehydrogenase-like protein
MTVVVYGTSPAALALAALLTTSGTRPLVVTAGEPPAACYRYLTIEQRRFHPYPWFWDEMGGTLGLVLERLGRGGLGSSRRLPVTALARLPEGDVVLPLSPDGLEAALLRRHPAQREDVAKWCATMSRLAQDFLALAAPPAPKARPSAELARFHGRRYLDYLPAVFSSPELVRLLAIFVPHRDISVAAMAGYLFGQILAWRPIPGGLGAVVGLCADILGDMDVVPEAAAQLVTEGGRVRSVVLASGRELRCEWFISAYDDHCTAERLFPAASRPPVASPRGVSREFMHLAAPQEALGPAAYHAITAFFAAPGDDGAARDDALPALVAFNPALVDDTLDAGGDAALTLWRAPGSRGPWQHVLRWAFPDLDVAATVHRLLPAHELGELIGVRDGDIHRWVVGAEPFLWPGRACGLGLENLACLGEFGCAWFFSALLACRRVPQVGVMA